jgi:hypothetical protein
LLKQETLAFSQEKTVFYEEKRKKSKNNRANLTFENKPKPITYRGKSEKIDEKTVKYFLNT